MKDNNIAIDDLLKVVAPALIEKYEANILGGQKLVELNTRYKSVKVDPFLDVRAFMKKALFFLFLSFAFTLILAFVLSNSPFREVSLVPLSIYLCVFLIVAIWYTRVISKNSKSLNYCTPILEEFRKAVQSLNPQGRPVVLYDWASVRENCVQIAVKILTAELAFDTARLRPNRETINIVHCGNWLLASKKELEIVEVQAIQFGLDFRNDGIFESAKEYMKRSCP